MQPYNTIILFRLDWTNKLLDTNRQRGDEFRGPLA
jgi:hypothetical protein